MTTVLVFARAPLPGRVKTRLASAVGAARARSVYRRTGRGVVRRLTRRHDVTVWYDPPDAVDVMRAWLGPCRLRPQVEGDLGTRMAAAIASHAAEGARPIVVVGTDAPAVDPGRVTDARAALDRADVVIGPARDGGYYLIGVSKPVPELFQDIPWGGAEVTRRTLERCAAGGLSCETLRVARDLDTAADLFALGLAVS